MFYLVFCLSSSPASSTPPPPKKAAAGKKGATGKSPKPTASAMLTAATKNVYVLLSKFHLQFIFGQKDYISC